MTTAHCHPIAAPLPLELREGSADPLADFLRELADLDCALQRKRLQLATIAAEDPRVVHARRGLESLAEHVRELGLEAAAVHQELVHERLA